MLFTKGQMNTAQAQGKTPQELFGTITVEGQVSKEKELSRDEIKTMLEEQGIEYSNKATTKTLKKLLGE